MLKTNSQPKLMLVMLLLASTAAAQTSQENRGFPQRGRGPGEPGWSDGRGWSERDKQERIDRLSKTLAFRIGESDPAPENVFLHSRASELLERTKQVRSSNFQFDRLARAVDSLLRASDRISGARKPGAVEPDHLRRDLAPGDTEAEKRIASEFLQRCYFRIQQADYFAGLSGEKEARKYVSTSRILYQQARSAYDARQYARAQMLGDASSSIVAALENIAHASLNVPDPPIIK